MFHVSWTLADEEWKVGRQRGDGRVASFVSRGEECDDADARALREGPSQQGSDCRFDLTS